MTDLDRLRKRLTAATRPIAMPTLRREFPGGLTQRVSELKRLGVPVKCLRQHVKGKLRTAYYVERSA